MKEELTMMSYADEIEKKEFKGTLVEWYSSTLADYACKMTIASVLFFISFPWAACFWPPYYFMRRGKE